MITTIEVHPFVCKVRCLQAVCHEKFLGRPEYKLVIYFSIYYPRLHSTTQTNFFQMDNVEENAALLVRAIASIIEDATYHKDPRIAMRRLHDIPTFNS